MRYSTELKYRKCIKGKYITYIFFDFQENFVINMVDTASKTGIDAAKTASKRVVQKTTEATEDLIGNKIADKFTSLGETKSKEKEDERREMCIPPENRKQIIDDIRLFHIKMEYQTY